VLRRRTCFVLHTKVLFRWFTIRVARWFVFKPKIPIWVNFGGPQIGKCLYIKWPLGVFFGDLGYFMTICYVLYSFGTFFPVWVSCTKKNLATLFTIAHIWMTQQNGNFVVFFRQQDIERLLNNNEGTKALYMYVKYLENITELWYIHLLPV
jgi:hypothetical protein